MHNRNAVFGAMVNIVGEDIVKDTNMKVYKLKEERFVTEA